MTIDTERILPSIYDETKPQKKYILRLVLDGTEIRISRDIVCPSNIRLSYLSELLVRTMGWTGNHEQMFIDSDGAEYISPSMKENFDKDQQSEESECREFNDWTLGDILRKTGDQMTWIYDPGDNFTHTLTLREVQDYTDDDGEQGEPGYFITSGDNSSPPDDVGGADSYDHMLDVLDDPDDEEYESYKDWLPDDFDPTYFNIQEARLRVWDFLRTVETIKMRLEDCIHS